MVAQEFVSYLLLRYGTAVQILWSLTKRTQYVLFTPVSYSKGLPGHWQPKHPCKKLELSIYVLNSMFTGFIREEKMKKMSHYTHGLWWSETIGQISGLTDLNASMIYQRLPMAEPLAKWFSPYLCDEWCTELDHRLVTKQVWPFKGSGTEILWCKSHPIVYLLTIIIAPFIATGKQIEVNINVPVIYPYTTFE